MLEQAGLPGLVGLGPEAAPRRGVHQRRGHARRAARTADGAAEHGVGAQLAANLLRGLGRALGTAAVSVCGTTRREGILARSSVIDAASPSNDSFGTPPDGVSNGRTASDRMGAWRWAARASSSPGPRRPPATSATAAAYGARRFARRAPGTSVRGSVSTVPLQPLQRVQRLRRALQALLAILDERAADEAFEFRGDVGPQRPRRSRLAVQDGVERHGRRGALERPRAGGHFIEHHAVREQVAARVDGLAARLLRRHVRRRADGHAQLGERVRRRHGVAIPAVL